jgi:hypothetical protein
MQTQPLHIQEKTEAVMITSEARKAKEEHEFIKPIRVVYVAGAFRAKTQWGIKKNVDKAEEASLMLWKMGYAVICPHTMTKNFQNECPDDVWLDGCLELLRRADAIYMLDNWRFSIGSCEEYRLAQELGLTLMGDVTQDDRFKEYYV